MEEEVTDTTPARMSATTQLAVEAFSQLLRVEHLLERKRWALEDSVRRVPAEERNEYAAVTDQLLAEAEERWSEVVEKRERQLQRRSRGRVAGGA
jgi:hypothetical protein